MSFPTKNPQGAGNMKIEAGSFSPTGSMTDAPQIDSKNLSIIEDQLQHEALAYKKCSVYSGYFQDQALKSIANTAAQHHKQHFDALQNYLNSHR